MRTLLFILLTFSTFLSFAQEDKEEEKLLATKKANNYVYEGNELATSEQFVPAEKEYRKAMSAQPSNVAGAYNLATSYYKKNNYEEALYRYQQAAKNATTKTEKHKAFHNIGTVLMQNKQCKEAVEAFKNALRNDPTDDETRYNLGLAKECAEQQKDDQKDDDKDKDKDKKDENKDDQKDKKDENKDNQDKKEGDDKKDDKGNPKDEKKDEGKGDDKKEQKQPQQQPGQLSPQQIKNLLEAMNNQEQRTQEKINAEKQKGVKIKTDKDW